MVPSSGPLPDGEGWAYERRWHGVRALVTDDTGRILITDGAGTDISLPFPEIRRIGRALGHREIVLDGVIVPVDPGSGEIRDDRRGLTRRMRITSDSGARNAARTAPLLFVAFDVLWVDGRSATSLPWEVRRRQLDDLRLDGPGWTASPLLAIDDAVAMLDDGPGIVAKRHDSFYEFAATSHSWVAVD